MQRVSLSQVNQITLISAVLKNEILSCVTKTKKYCDKSEKLGNYDRQKHGLIKQGENPRRDVNDT